MVLLKRVNGRMMVIERHFYAVFFILIAVGMTVAVVTIEVILPEAGARHEESGGTEPHCYTSSCEKRFGSNDGSDPEDNPSSEYEIVQEQKETEMDRINDEMKRVIKEKEDAEALVLKLEELLPEMRVQLLDQENVENLAGNAHFGMDRTLKDMKKAYREAYDSAETIAEIDAAKQLKVDYINFEHDYATLMAEENKQHDKTILLEEQIEEKEDELDEARELIIELKEELEQLRMDMFKAGRNDQFISIRLGGTCEMLIKSGSPTNCPTYRELVPMFDNTEARFSGHFEDLGYDINRVPSKMQNYELYYEQVPSWLVITVDPDNRMMQKSSMIEIAPNRVHWTCTEADSACNIPVDWDRKEVYVQYDIHINKYCTKALVSPDIEVITEAVNQFIESCAQPQDEWRKIITLPLYGDFKIYNHGWISDFLAAAGVE